VVVGDQGVGKTHIIFRFTKEEIPNNILPTIGVEFATKIVDLGEGGKIKA
jgi:GTPase SAR1 family protein